jgi:hypothetical protein
VVAAIHKYLASAEEAVSPEQMVAAAE